MTSSVIIRCGWCSSRSLLPNGLRRLKCFFAVSKNRKSFCHSGARWFLFASRQPGWFGLRYLNGQQIIEISTGTGGLHPSITNYYFVIDPRTNKAVPRKLFKGDKGLTNEISSDLLMDEPEHLDLPQDAAELNIIRGHKLAPAFSIYAEDDEGK